MPWVRAARGGYFMFEDSLVDDRIKTHRGATTVLSFLLQVGLVGIVLLIPLIFTQALPLNVTTMTALAAPPPPPPPPPPAASAPATQPKPSPVETKALTVPLKIPQKIAQIHDEPTPDQSAGPPPAIAGVPGGVPGGVAGGTIGGVVGGVMNGIGTAIPKVATPKRVRVSQGVSEGLLVHKVTPTYPPLARQARVQGAVVLQASIGKDGSIQNLKLVSGHPMLSQAAINAVKQWKYKPYFLNGEAVEVDTTITVNFTMGAMG